MHPDAELAAEAALEAQAQKGQAGFWKMHDAPLREPGVDGGAQATGARRVRREARARHGEVGGGARRHTHKAAIEADQKAAEAAGIGGTPGFLINGYVLSGAQPYARFRQLVRARAAGSGEARASRREVVWYSARDAHARGLVLDRGRSRCALAPRAGTAPSSASTTSASRRGATRDVHDRRR